MWHSRPPRDPPPFLANALLNFHFDFLHPSLSWKADQKAVIMQYEAFHSGVWFTNPSFQKWAFDQSISLSTEGTLYTGRLLWIHYGNREWQSMNIWEMNTLGGMVDVMLCLRAQPINAMHETDPPSPPLWLAPNCRECIGMTGSL